MKELYEAARHLVWNTQFGLSVAIPPVAAIWVSLWLRRTMEWGGWIVALGVIIGVLGAIGGLRGSLRAIERQGRGKEESASQPISFNEH